MVVKALLESVNSGARTMHCMQLERDAVSESKEKRGHASLLIYFCFLTHHRDSLCGPSCPGTHRDTPASRAQLIVSETASFFIAPGEGTLSM